MTSPCNSSGQYPTMDMTSKQNVPVKETTVVKKTISTYQHAVISLTAMSHAVLWFHPLMQWKIKKQMDVTNKQTPVNKPQPKPVTRAPWSIHSVIQNMRALYKGVGVNLLQAPIYAVTGTINGALKNKVSANGQVKLSEGQQVAIAGTSALAGAKLACVAELGLVQKGKILRETGISPTATTVYSTIANHYGLSGLYRGLTMSISRDVPFGVAMLYASPKMEKAVRETLPDWLGYTKPFVSTFVSGAVNGTLAALSTQPADTIKTSMQTNFAYRSNWEVCKDIFHKNGKQAVEDFQNPNKPQIWSKGRVFKCLTIQDIYTLGGCKAFWAGAVPRWGVFLVATPTIVGTSNVLKNLFEGK